MERPEREAVLRLADAITHGEAVDWGREAAARPALGRTLDGLREVEAILAGYRALAGAGLEPPAAPPAAAPRRRTGPPRGSFRWGSLRVLRRIGEGAFGEVFRAWDETLERDVALKLWRGSDRDPATERFLLEARRLARVRHPNVLVVHGADRHGGRAGMWTDLVAGRSLERLLQLTGPFGPREAALVGIELCRALAAVHAAGLVHRDVKTANVMRERGGRIVLMDFGAVGELGPAGTVRAADGAIGTPLTLAPEQLDGAPATPATDLYALGVLLYRLLTGAHPVEAESLEELRARHRGGGRVALRARRPDLPAPLVEAVEQALDPVATRPAEAAAMERALAAALVPAPVRGRRRPPGTAAPAPLHAPPEPLTPFRGRERELAAATALLAAGRGVAIEGPAGAGKTRLALALAARLAGEFPGGPRHADLHDLDDPAGVAPALAAAFGVEAGGRPALAALAERLGEAPALLVADGADRVLSAIEAAAAALEGCRGLRWIVTGRRAAHVPGLAALAIEAEEPAAPAPAEAGRVPLVGRAPELAALDAAAGEARRRAGRTVLVTGEAGVGKSRLLEEARRRAEARGVLCLGGRCSYRGGRNFEPFVEALEELARRFPAAAAAGGALAGLESLLDPRREPRHREQVWVLIDATLKRVARRETLALFLDDLHWADEGTLALLDHVARHAGAARLLIVGSCRPEEVPAAGAAGAATADAIRLLSSAPSFTRLPLAPLDPSESEALVGALIADPGAALACAPDVHRRAQGNPFFTIEIARDLAASGWAAGGPAALPQTVTDVVMRRLARLAPRERDVLDVAAVEGERFTADTLAAATGLPRLDLLRALRSLEQDHHLVAAGEDGHRFSHGLIREVLLGALPAELRREIHGVVADHLARRHGERPDHAAAIAYQLAEARRHAEAVPRFLAAAREARRLFLHDRALDFLGRALEAHDRSSGPAAGRAAIQRARCEVLLLLGRPHLARAAAEEALRHEDLAGGGPGRAAALEALGEAALAQGDLAAAERFLTQARGRYAEGGDLAPVARCDQKLGAAATRRGDFEQALLRLGAALECMEGAGDSLAAARIRVDLGDALYRRGEYPRAFEAFERAVAELARLDERHDLARGLNRLGNALFQSGRTEPAEARYRQALALAVELDDVQSRARLEANLGNVRLVQGDPERALESYRRALASFEEIGDRTGAGQTRMALGNVCFARGDFAEAAEHYRLSLEPREAMGDRPGLANALDNLGVVELHLGRLAAAHAHQEAALRLRAELGDRPGSAESALNLGCLAAVLGEEEEAERRFAEAESAAAALGDPRRRARVLLARACVRLWSGDRGAVTELLEAAAAEPVDEPSIRARIHLLRGLAAGPSPAGEDDLARALEAAERSGSRIEEAAARLALAGRALAAGRDLEARDQLDAALALLGAGRMPLLELHAARLALALARRGAAPAGVAPAALEERIEALAAALAAERPAGRAPRRDYREPLFPVP